MNRHYRIISLLAACLFVVPAAAAPRNVVIFVTDDQSPDLGCYGNHVIQTPHMDALAADGVRFTHAFCTTASCSASRSVILTGLHNHANGQYGHQHGYHKFSSYQWVQSLPVLLAKAGYRTARIGKHHNAPEEVYYFETKIPGSARSPAVMAENCREFIAAEDERPFFLYFATSDPHRGGGVATELPQQPNRFGNRPAGYPGIDEVHYDPRNVLVPPFLPDTPACRAEIAQYYQSISRIDQGLGRLVEILKAEGRWDDTLMIFTSDHGMAFPGAKTTLYEGGMRVPFLVRDPNQQKRGVVNEAMISFVDITPSVLDWAGALDAATGCVDTDVAMRTHHQARQLPEPEPYGFHGRSFLPILDARQVPPEWNEVHASHTFHEIQMYYPMRVVRGRRYKLIWNIAHPLPFPFASDLWAAPTWQAQFEQGMDANYGQRTVGQYIQRPEFELFDLEREPRETTNVAHDPEYADVLEKMKSRLKEFQQRTDDPWILKWRYE